MVVQNKSNVIYLVFTICLLIELICGQEKEVYYDRKYDYYDVDSLIENRRLLRKYMDCFIEQGPCTPIGRVFRRRLPEIVRTACKKCSPQQRKLARKAFNAFKWYFPDVYKQLMAILDPKNEYNDAFENAIKN